MDTQTPVIPPRVRTWAYVIGLVAGAAGPVLAAFGMAEGWIALASGIAGVASAIALGYRPAPLVGPSEAQKAEVAYAQVESDLLEWTDWSGVAEETPPRGTRQAGDDS